MSKANKTVDEAHVKCRVEVFCPGTLHDGESEVVVLRREGRLPEMTKAIREAFGMSVGMPTDRLDLSVEGERSS